jgi:hypothetical protein
MWVNDFYGRRGSYMMVIKLLFWDCWRILEGIMMVYPRDKEKITLRTGHT